MIEKFKGSFYHLITHNQISIINNLQLDKLTEIYHVIKYYLMDENDEHHITNNFYSII